MSAPEQFTSHADSEQNRQRTVQHHFDHASAFHPIDNFLHAWHEAHDVHVASVGETITQLAGFQIH